MSSDRTGISWCDSTWGPIRGCSRVSEGCRHCYAERQALRITRMDRGLGKPEGQGAYDGLVREVGGEARWTGQVRLVPELLDQPLRWKRPRRIFVNSMSDLFHEGLNDAQIAAVFGAMALAPQHTFQVLTKRPERMLRWLRFASEIGDDLRSWSSLTGHQEAIACVVHYLHERGVAVAQAPAAMRAAGAVAWPLPNVWLGVSAEDQATLDARVPDLLRCPAAVRWLSLEPQLGPVDARPYLALGPDVRLDWIVQGGESGPRARPFDLAWARSVRDQCKAAGVAYYLKQIGANAATMDERDDSLVPPGFVSGTPARMLRGCAPVRTRHRAGADPAEWPEDLRIQEFPEPRR